MSAGGEIANEFIFVLEFDDELLSWPTIVAAGFGAPANVSGGAFAGTREERPPGDQPAL
jgi:hypothetical protein